MSDKTPDKPKRARNAYIFFSTARSREVAQLFKQRGITVSAAIISQQLAAEWHQLPLPQREIWEAMAEQDRARYDREYDEYESNLARVTLAGIRKADQEDAVDAGHDSKRIRSNLTNLQDMVSSESIGTSELTRRLYSFSNEDTPSGAESDALAYDITDEDREELAALLNLSDPEEKPPGSTSGETTRNTDTQGPKSDDVAEPSPHRTLSGVPDPLAASSKEEQHQGSSKR